MTNKKLFLTAGIVVVVVGSALLFYGKTLNDIEEQAIPQQAPQPTSAAAAKQTYTMADVATHSNESDCWLVIENKVYDVTSFIPNHPGGKEILKGCGKDATALFQGEREHQENNASTYLPTYMIGSLQ